MLPHYVENGSQMPNFEAARAYALRRLASELAPWLYYHSLGHTRDDVAPAAERLAYNEGISGLPLLLLRTAAYFHDIGFIERREEHERAGVRIANAVLPEFGYSSEQIEVIGGLIMATRLPQTPRNVFEQILADADLDALGRDDFSLRNQALRAELARVNNPYDDETWVRDQIIFLEGHRYWTPSARSLRDKGKLRNLNMLRSWLSGLTGLRHRAHHTQAG